MEKQNIFSKSSRVLKSTEDLAADDEFNGRGRNGTCQLPTNLGCLFEAEAGRLWPRMIRREHSQRRARRPALRKQIGGRPSLAAIGGLGPAIQRG